MNALRINIIILFLLHSPLLCMDWVDLGYPYGKAKLIEDIDCSSDPDPKHFRQSDSPSKVTTILGQACRVLENDKDHMKYFAYRLGAGKGLQAGSAYLIRLNYPEDKARSMYFLNRANETGIGLASGEAVADCLHGRYVNNSPESIQYPLAQDYCEWNYYFHLHDRFPAFESIRGRTERTQKPEDGFWFVIAQHKNSNAPLSHGAAVSRIRLYEVPHTQTSSINYPHPDLPKRYIFCREEMADGVVRVPHGADEPAYRGLDNPIDWFEYKARYMQFIGMNTFSKDLLEFGHNQGWAAEPTDNSWYIQSSVPDRWQRMVAMLKRYNLFVLPMYEDGGSTGKHAYGKEKDIVNLQGNETFTHIEWLEKNAHADITDPRTLEELKKIFRITILDHKESVPFIGAWLRPRPMQMPMSFSDKALARYSLETGKQNITRKHLQSDKKTLEHYYNWWFQKRSKLLYDLSDYLSAALQQQAQIIFTCDATEPGRSLPGRQIVTDQVDKWKSISALGKLQVKDYANIVRDNTHGLNCLSPRPTWGNHEVHHASPWSDPQHYKDQDGVMLSYTFHRLFSVSNPDAFDSFRCKSGLAAIRHYSLNENEMEKQLGYFVCDVERSGAHSILNEARCLAYGDPRYLGYLISNTLANGFPQYKRAFNQAFLSLPAIPSRIIADSCSDPEIVVRAYESEQHGTYLAIINTGLQHKTSMRITLPAANTVTNNVSGKTLTLKGNILETDLYSGQVLSLHLR